MMKVYIGFTDVGSRLCTEAEIRVYLSSFFGGNGGLQTETNRNCNLTSWVSGCEPGWACSIGSMKGFSFQNSTKAIPPRTSDCKPCCAGFFCPQGLTCMIRKRLNFIDFVIFIFLVN